MAGKTGNESLPAFFVGKADPDGNYNIGVSPEEIYAKAEQIKDRINKEMQ